MNDSIDRARAGLGVSVGVLALLSLVAVGGRVLFEAWPNVAPIAGAALLAGHVVGRRLGRPVLAGVVPVVAMLLSDLLWFGSYEIGIMIAVYASLCGCVGLGLLLGRGGGRATWWRVGGASVIGSLGFFVVTNAAVWLAWYPMTSQGLMACFANALPFLKYTVLGDLFFAGTLFGTYATACWAVPALGIRASRRAAAPARGSGAVGGRIGSGTAAEPARLAFARAS
ncbi:MAG: DUF6580 family putative transport protein [Phycisphaerales bacterium]